MLVWQMQRHARYRLLQKLSVTCSVEFCCYFCCVFYAVFFLPYALHGVPWIKNTHVRFNVMHCFFRYPCHCSKHRVRAINMGCIVYTRDQLITLKQLAFTAREKPSIPEVIRRWRCGCRAGAKFRMKSRFKPCIPAVTIWNVRSLANTID